RATRRSRGRRDDAQARAGSRPPMWKFTLDTNCWIAVEENRPEAADIRALANAHAAGVADVAIVAISASEKQKGGRYLRNFEEFQSRLNSLQLGLSSSRLEAEKLRSDIS